MEGGDLQHAAHIILSANLIKDFDCYALAQKLAKLTSGSKKLAIALMSELSPHEQTNFISEHISDENLYFCQDMLKAFKCDIHHFPELLLISRSRSPLIDMAFTDDSDPKKVPLHVMADLVRTDGKLLQKFFMRLVRENKLAEASALFHTSSKLNKNPPNYVLDIVADLPPFKSSANPLLVQDKFASLSKGDQYLQMPSEVGVFWIQTVNDIPLLKQLVGKPIIGADCEWRCSMVNAYD